jgi:5-carboxymethyl-2-hydroxymuconate isomerase
MPHLTVEYTRNLQPTLEFADLFGRLHAVLTEVGGIKQENCKSRAAQLNEFFVGDGAADAGFVHLDVRFLEGRSSDVKREIGARMLAILQDWFRGEGLDAGSAQFTVEIRDIERAAYFKHPAGSLTY